MIKHQQTQKFGPIVGNLSAKIDYDYPENDGNKWDPDIQSVSGILEVEKSVILLALTGYNQSMTTHRI